jgi:hypothetical protein
VCCGHRLFGFLLGTALSGTAVYTYLLGEYKTSNDLLTEDIYVRLAQRVARKREEERSVREREGERV